MRVLPQRSHIIQISLLVLIFVAIERYSELATILLDLTLSNAKYFKGALSEVKNAGTNGTELEQAPMAIPDGFNGKPTKQNVMRILWWNTVFGGKANFYRVGRSKANLKRISKACKTSCEFVMDRSLANSSHAIIFNAWYKDLFVETVQVNGTNVTRPRDVPPYRDENQYYVYFSDEAPVLMVRETPLEPYNYFFNWTVNYRLDSDFRYTYGYVVKKRTEDIQKYDEKKDHRDILKGKTNLVSWVVSNCKRAPSGRNELVKELQKYIPVHIYGKCGKLNCKTNNCYYSSYKFYLAFENTLCLDYVTEKFFKALNHRMVPIVYGKANYGHRFPPGSFINVDSFASAKALGHYLEYLDQNDEEYLKYFRWRWNYTLSHTTLPTMHIYCGICARLHRDYGKQKSIFNLSEWLFKDRGNETPICTEPQVF